ncbi:MAG: hypothetical protein WD066_09145 [Planctomycetaceae bacterium]
MADTSVKKVNKSQAIRDYVGSHPNAKGKEIITGLREQGIAVSEGLVNNVKFRMQSGGQPKKAGRPKKSVKKTRAGRGGINKSQAIRDYLGENRGATPTEIRDGLQRQGIEVSHGLISMVKYGGGSKKKRKKKAARPAGRPAAGRPAGRPAGAAGGGGLSAKDLFEAKKLADRLGGTRKVREALDALEQLR